MYDITISDTTEATVTSKTSNGDVGKYGAPQLLCSDVSSKSY